MIKFKYFLSRIPTFILFKFTKKAQSNISANNVKNGGGGKLSEENRIFQHIRPICLWKPFLIMAVSFILALISIIFTTNSYLSQYISWLPEPSFNAYRWFSTISMLSIPLFLIGISLLLLSLTQTKGNIAGKSKLIFLFGVVFHFVGGLINIILFNILFDSEGPLDNFELINQLSYCGEFMSELGMALCMIATLFLIRSYLKGEIFGIWSA
jgi:hypothetical protein